MSENAKTLTFVAVGVLAVVVALATRPGAADVDEKTLVGEVLTKKFSSPDDAKRLRIVRFDEDTATLREFEVAEQDGLWTIPSKDGYPADATRQMAEAALSLKDRKILAVEGDNPGEHDLYGVVDPLSPSLVPGQKGVGTRVTLSDSNNDPLVDLIIGKAPKDSEGQRYVREAGRDVVYVIEVDPTKLSTKFDDWIEKDLLKLDALDLKQVDIKDYSAELVAGQLGIGIERDPRAEMTLALDEKTSKWTPVRLRKFDESARDLADVTLAEDEELNEESLNGLKTSLDDLEIVDVVRKPQGLSEDLKAGTDFMNNREAVLDLLRRGFTAASSSEGGPQEIVSSDGEVIATMKDGTEYVLRFGNLTDVAGPDQKEKKEAAAEAGEDSPAKSDVHRYLFVMARFNEDAVGRPELQPLPELPAEESAASAEESPSDETQSDETAAATPAEGETAAADGKTDAAEGTTEAGKEKETTDAAAKETETEKPADEKEKADGKENTETDKQSALDKIIAERKRIETENQQKLDAYQAELKKGQENVKDLNLRFGDWYFVIANDVFNKVRLGHDDVVKKKAAKDEASGEQPGAAGPAGIPGSAIPGLPGIPGAGQQ